MGADHRSIFRVTETVFGTAPAVDDAETDNAYEITTELPGLDEKNIEVKLANGAPLVDNTPLERSFQVPEGVDTDKVAAGFKNGICQ